MPKRFKDFRRSVAECKSKLRSLRASREAGVEPLTNMHATIARDFFVRTQNFLPPCPKAEVEKKRFRSVDISENVTFGEGQLAVEADALRRNRP